MTQGLRCGRRRGRAGDDVDALADHLAGNARGADADVDHRRCTRPHARLRRQQAMTTAQPETAVEPPVHRDAARGSLTRTALTSTQRMIVPPESSIARFHAFDTHPPQPHCPARVAEHPHPRRRILASHSRGRHDICADAEHALRVRHQDGEAAVGRGEPGDAVRRAVRIVRVALGRPAAGCRRSAARRAASRRRVRRRRANSARPSPCATAIGMRLPAMPAKNSDGDRPISTSARRASNCSERLRTKRGQCARPGNDLVQVAHHLAAVAHAERERVAAREERRELVARARVEQDRLGPALARAEHVAVGEAAARREALEIRRASTRPARMSLMCTSRRRSRRGRTPPPSRPGR